MRLLIIRHGDPDYAVDSLTEKGRREAEFLAERLAKEKIDAFYVSPLGRARDTAAYTLNAMHAQGKTLGWLREFHAPIWDKAAKKIRGRGICSPPFTPSTRISMTCTAGRIRILCAAGCG